MTNKNEKTNVMRILGAAGVPYTAHAYDTSQLDACHAADDLGVARERLFKTLVTVAPGGGHYVFLLPAGATLDLKRAARAAGVKSVAMLPQKDLLPLTGYVHGGCSPIGMKKPFPTFVDESAAGFPTILFSGGHIGFMVEVAPEALLSLVGATYAPLTAD